MTWQEELEANMAASAPERQAAIANAKAALPQEPAVEPVENWNQWRTLQLKQREPATPLAEIDPALMGPNERMTRTLDQTSRRHPK